MISKMIKRLNYPTGLLFMVLLAVLGGCRSFGTDLNSKTRTMPSSFQAGNSTGNLAQLNWKEFFSDSLLISLIDTALQWNFDVQLAWQKVEIARAGHHQAKGNLFPQVGIGTNSGMRKFGLYTMDGAGNISTEILPGKKVPIHLPDLNLHLNTSWELDIWGKLRAQRKSAQSAYLASVEGRHLVVSTLVSHIASAYYQLLAFDNELNTVREYILKQEEALEVARIQKETGRANELASMQFEAQLLQSRAMEYDLLQQIVQTENLINFLMGRYPQKINRHPERLNQKTAEILKVGTPAQLLSNRPDIRQAEHLLAMSKFDVQAARSAYFPNLNLTGLLGFQAFQSQLLFLNPASLAYSAIGSIAAPLLNISSLKAGVRKAKAAQASALHVYQQAMVNGFMEVSNELARIHHLGEMSALKQQQRDLLANAVETASELFLNSKAAYVEVLFARQNALRTEIEWIELRKNQHIAAVNLYKALGGGWR